MTDKNSGIYDLDALLAAKEEATGVKDGRVSFNFRGEVFTFRDPVFLTDDELEDMREVNDFGPDVCAWYMGDDEYDRFIAVGGSSNMWAMVLDKHLEANRGADGNPTGSNRSQRRRAARKR